MTANATQRWHTFLEKIEGRHAELLAGAEEALPQLLDLSGFDLTPFSVALMAVRAQCIELSQKVDKTWSDQAEAALESAGANLDEEQARRSRLDLSFQLALRRTEVKVAGDAAQQIIAKARDILSAGFKCTRCGAPLSPKEQFFRSQYVTCGFCQTVNTFEPGTIARQVEHFAVHALAEQAALEKEVRFLEAEHHWRHSRDAGRAGKEQLIVLYSAFVDAYLLERVRWLPDLQKDVEADRRARLDAFLQGIA